MQRKPWAHLEMKRRIALRSLAILLSSVVSLVFYLPVIAHPRAARWLNLERARALTDQDRDEALKTYLQAKQLVEQGSADSLRAARQKFLQAAQLFHTAGKAWEEAACLTNLAAVESGLGEKQAALDHFKQALPLLQSTDDRPGEAGALANIASVYDDLGEKQKALEYNQRALTIFRALHDRAGEGVVLSNIGKVELDLAESQKAIDYFNQSLPIRREVGDRVGEATTLANLGNASSILGDKSKALDFYSQALPLLQAAPYPALEAVVLSNIGEIYRFLSEFKKALNYFQKALAIQRTIGNRSGEAITLNNLGLIYAATGEKQQALDYYHQALSLARVVDDPRGAANILSNIGEVYYSTGDYEKALDYYNQALPIRRGVGDRVGETTTLNNIGGTFQKLADRQQALNYYNQALALAQSVGDRASQAVLLNNVGELHWELGENQKAIDSLNQALPLRRIVGDRSGEALTLSNIALVYENLGEIAQALQFHERALSLERQIADRNGEASTLFNIASLERDRNHLMEARTRMEAALNIVDLLRSKIASQNLRAGYFSTVQSYYEFYIDLLIRLHRERPADGFDALALQASERSKARSLLETLAESRADIREGVDAGLLERERLLQARLNERAQAQMKLLSSNDELAKAIAQEIDTLTAEFQQVESEIRQKSPRYAALTQPQPLTLKEIQTQVLDPDTMLLEYSLGAEHSYLWAVTPTTVQTYELTKRAEIESAARHLYELLNARNKRVSGETAEQRQARVTQADGDIPATAAALSRLVLGPASEKLGRRRLLIVADGALQFIPFAALPLATRETPSVDSKSSTDVAPRPLVMDHEIVNLPSASTLAMIRRESAGRQPAPKTVVALADPVFSKNDERIKTGLTKTDNKPEAAGPERVRDLELVEAAEETGVTNGDLKVPRLPGSRREAEEIVGMVPAATRKLALDFAASRATATSLELSQYRYVHFSTHGFVNSVHPELSGIVFSLVNERGEPQDGFLRAHEIFNLKLPAELVVLSACQTGIGKEVKGEGLVSLTRGFMYAGAPRVVVSLWSVSEMGTAELMVRFYREMLQGGKSPVAALRAAEISLMNEKRWASPFYWAPFLLQGEWR